ncbi:MAG: MFS transporter [Candidatus Limnocylindrales bacterium]
MTLEAEPTPPLGSQGHFRAALRRPGFPAYVFAAGAASAGWSIGMVLISWVALIETGDPFAVGLVYAVRFLMLLLLGIPAGLLADRMDRRTLFAASVLGNAAVAGALALVAAASGDSLSLLVIIIGAILLGSLDATRIAASHAFAFDLVGPALATTGFGVANLAVLSGAVVGSAASGVVLDQVGLAAAFVLMAIVYLGAAAALVGARVRTARAPRASAEHGSGLQGSLTLLRRDRVLRMLAFVVIIVEIFGFSCISLVPVFTRDVFGAGSDAYGLMNAIRSVGGVLALLVVISLGPRAGTGPAVLATGALFGVGLVAFAISPGFAIAAIPMLLVGGAAAASDSLSQTLMQRSVTDAERGAAVGVWAFALGFGPVGYVAAGAMAGRYGPVPTQVLFGLALAGLSLLLMTRPVLWRLR